MKLVVGLGNPGEKYKDTRHNVGFMVIDKLKKYKENLRKVVLVKPKTFMNKSGVVVAKLKRFYKISVDDLYVVHDDLDLKLGEYKIQKGVGPKVHNGVSSVEEQLGSKEFWRVRVGVDNRGGRFKIDSTSEQSRLESKPVSDEKSSSLQYPMKDFSGADYVLGKFMESERKIIDGVIGRVVEELRGVLE